MALAIPRITEFLSEWIHTVEISNSSLKKFAAIINPDSDLFFTFNYTQTLEKIYGCPTGNICHIHGISSDDPFFQIDELILGHCGRMDYSNDEGIPYEMGPGLQSIYEQLRKDTANQICRHKDFFKKISSTSICMIYSFGFSFSDVDMPYMKKICDSLTTNNVTWFLSSYENQSTRKEHEAKLRKCGFQGNFDLFSVS